MDVNVPGVMAMLVAPLVAQLRLLLVPEFMFVGFAVKDVTVGAEPVTGVGLDLLVAVPQLVRPMQPSRRRTIAQRPSPRELRPGEVSLLLQRELGESMRNPSVAVAHTSLVIAHLSWLLVARTESGSGTRIVIIARIFMRE